MPYYHKLTIDESVLKEYFDELTKVQIKSKNKFYRLKPSMLSQLNVNINNAYRSVFMKYGSERYFTIIDRASVRKIRDKKWRPGVIGDSFDDKNYVVTGNKPYKKLHRVILGIQQGNTIDVHHVANTFDNRESKNVHMIVPISKTAHGSMGGNRLPLLTVDDVNKLKTLLNFIKSLQP